MNKQTSYFNIINCMDFKFDKEVQPFTTLVKAFHLEGERVKGFRVKWLSPLEFDTKRASFHRTSERKKGSVVKG